MKRIILACLFLNVPLSMEASHDAHATPKRFLEAITAGVLVAAIAHKEIGNTKETGFEILNNAGRIPLAAASVFGAQLFAVDITCFLLIMKRHKQWLL